MKRIDPSAITSVYKTWNSNAGKEYTNTEVEPGDELGSVFVKFAREITDEERETLKTSLEANPLINEVDLKIGVGVPDVAVSGDNMYWNYHMLAHLRVEKNPQPPVE